jgi:4-amino-4-deoxy-L-arabinose transferase-like glycosyltransferase
VAAGGAVTPRQISRRTTGAVLAGILVAGGLLRLWHLAATGLNSDEAVYAGQGASIAGVPALEPYFPTFRAHPLLFQTLLSLGFHTGDPELFGRLASAAYGLATVVVVYFIGRDLYGRRAGLVAAGVLALMPYHVIVSRQILLDGPMVFWSTVTLFAMVRLGATQRPYWLYAVAAALGATLLSKESSAIMVAAIYAVLALTPSLRIGWRHIAGSIVVLGLVVSVFPLALAVAGATRTGGNFLAWQLFRRPNHEWTFYPATVPVAIGLAVVVTAALGVWLLRRDGSWRETLLLAWIIVPVGFFQVFPVKGYQYLLPIAPAVAVLAARFLVHYDFRRVVRSTQAARRLRWGLVAALLLSLAVPAWGKVQPSTSDTFLAGSGGVPGGREAGLWIRRNVPEGARMMSVGPSMANILQYYGHRKIYGLSVSPNPLHRNPVYEPMKNPDRLIRDNELQYIVWDAFSADRTPFFSQKLTRYIERYHGRVAHQETVPVTTRAGRTANKPVITIYEVRP